MNSANPTSSSSKAPASKPKKPAPWSMDHWTSCLITRNGTPLPRGTVAYAIGAAFPPEHLRSIAEAMCTPEQIEAERGNHLAALLFHLIETDSMQTLLHITDFATGQPYLLWVLRVTPGRHGKSPVERIEPEKWTLFRQFLFRRGLSKDIIKSIRKCVTPWPQGAAYPVWVPDMLLHKMQKQAKEKHAAEPDQNASRAIPTVPEQSGAHGKACPLPEHGSSSSS
ncbi:hypothetical protein L226DRAFT_540488 [Lentinus tigrinus ALCF2SS1-7]|uniref:Uncharacterized protein n=1 Tax=Lentinus tigrinus ALCF2SS1-6 TaxID=1328759 RepID=A0A5C2RRA8_9APHY|nr:hypothetical protein L227DRAFT_581352 [Lentinus tigrinus ALCF2SS1-6]RPD68674.1 hypothetical protein L226DRAFT_540488 [Lentinus tigrinus ALCF2SS1-7]